LELLQNADDEQSEEVLIELDTKKNIFKIANRGSHCNPFKIGGIKSLMLPNFSPKTSKKYIGNKGLGFRSIINWSNKITINSQNLDISFSKKIAIDFYNSICNHKEDNINDLIPIAFLCVPEVKDNIQDEWTTIIEIHYKEDKTKDIKKQLSEVKHEVLLFVNYISKLTITIDHQHTTIERIKENNKIYLNGTLWDIYENQQENDNALLPKSLWEKSHIKEYYELKIAIKEKFDYRKNLLYSYFPTEINIDFPFIIHGTFDLDSSRNNLNDSDKNRYILEKLVDLIIYTAKKLTKHEVSYKALEFLTHNNENPRLDKLGFYESINDKADELAIFPCLDNQYRKKENVIFISDDFSTFIEKICMQTLFPEMLKSSQNSSIDLAKKSFNTIKNNDINILSKKIDNIDDRVELIYLTYQHFNNYKFDLFVDEKKKIILATEEAYTPKFSNMENLVLPKYLENNIKFLNKKLGEQLLNKFDIKDKKSYRVLIDRLSNITNLKEYETATILERIIAEAKKINTLKSIQEMIVSLYKNFKINEVSISTKTIPCLSQSNEIIDSNNLFLSKTYPSGGLTEKLFVDIFKTNQFVADINAFDFGKNEEKEQIEQFFLWLGVNKYTKYTKIKYNLNYQQFIFTRIEEPSNFKDLSFELLKIEYLAEILQHCKEKHHYEKFILWILSDEKIHEELVNKKTLQYFYRTYQNLYGAPSYILYQLCISGIFKDYLITNEKLSLLMNETVIDFNSTLFDNYKKADIESLILKIGAVERIENLSIGRIKTILGNLPEKSPDGKQTQTIYKAVRNHKNKLNDTSIKLCAKKGGKLDYYNQDEIYYVNTTKLPKKIIDDIPILNVPPRLGNVIEFFGVKNIKDIKIDIASYIIHNNLSEMFNQFFEKIKVFILVYRFEDLKDKSTKDQALNKLKKIHISLCSKVVYTIESKEESKEYLLDNNDYIESNHKYYIKVANNSFDSIRKTLDFRETFADIIGSIFNINNVEKFIRLVSDNINETEEIIKRNLGYEALNEAREYLNIADEFSSFWRTIYKVKGKVYNEKFNSKSLENIKQELKINTDLKSIDYKNLKSDKSCENIKKLFNELGLTIEDFNRQEPYYKLDFTEYHKTQLINRFHSNFDTFEKILYYWCQNNKKEKVFLDLIGKYENADKQIKPNTINLDYQAIINKFVKENFGFSLNDVQTNINIQEVYEQNKNKVNFELLVNNEDKSLLYFNNKFKEIQDIIKTYENKDDDINTNSSSDTGVPTNMRDTTLDNPPPNTNNTNPSNGGYGTYNPDKDKDKKNKGNKAEQCAYNWLIDKYGKSKVKWFSKESDSGHYDLRYEANENNWKYVEVKTYSNQIFYLSKPEKTFADANKGQYEIFFVELPANKKCADSKIYIIRDVDYSDEENFRLVANKYEVHYKLKTQQNL
jgi:hypothetical protein